MVIWNIIELVLLWSLVVAPCIVLGFSVVTLDNKVLAEDTKGTEVWIENEVVQMSAKESGIKRVYMIDTDGNITELDGSNAGEMPEEEGTTIVTEYNNGVIVEHMVKDKSELPEI